MIRKNRLDNGYLSKGFSWKVRSCVFIFILEVLFILITLPSFGNAADKLLYQSDFTYIGSFRLPTGTYGSSFGLGYGGNVMTYNPAHNSLFISSHVYEQWIGEFSIPAPRIAPLDNLNISTVLQNFADITEGNMERIVSGGGNLGGNGVRIGGLMVYNNTLYGTVYPYYDTETTVISSHFKSGLNLSTTGDFGGMYTVGSPAQGVISEGFISGWMLPIPLNYQSALGYTHLTGNGCLAITSRSSQGPALYGFNPTRLGIDNPVSVTPFQYYVVDTHMTLGAWGSTYNGTTNFYNGTTAIRSAHWPTGSKTVFFVGIQGTGPFCYGTGTACGDPVMDAQGTHAYPYRYQIWAFNADDLVAVKNGAKNPWDPVPYAAWALPMWGGSSAITSVESFGSAYDQANKLLYVAQRGIDTAWQYKEGPIINVYSVNVDTPSPRNPVPPTIRSIQ